MDATFHPVLDGDLSMKMPEAQVAKGEFVELVPDRRIVFRWGWVDHPDVPPASTTVEIELTPDPGPDPGPG